jgi:hypothetical protein
MMLTQNTQNERSYELSLADGLPGGHFCTSIRLIKIKQILSMK